MNRRPTPSIIDDVLTTDTTRPATIRNDAIKVDGGTQMRAQLDAYTVAEYADTMTASGWGAFPPIIAYYDGSDYWLADGFHRLAAWRSIANYSDALIPADVRSGTRRDAILHAAGANASHGLRRTNADKRRAVETLLRDDDWRHWSDREIARRCNVSAPMVAEVRRSVTVNSYSDDSRTYTTKHGTTATMQTASINATRTLASETPARFLLSTDDLPDDLVAAGWTVRSKDLGSYWVVNETNGMESAIVRNWDGFTTLCAHLQKRLPSHTETMATAIRNAVSETTIDLLPPADTPLPAWADEPPSISKPGQSVADYLAYRDGAWASGMAAMDIREWRDWLDAQEPAPTANAYDALTPPDSRIPAARNLMALYGAVIDSEEQYGELTGRFSDTLGVKRDLTNMIAHLADLIAAIEHPEEVAPDA